MIAGKHESSQLSSLPASPSLEKGAAKPQAIEVLAEIYELLEAYSPQWYTEELHRKALSVLQRSGKI